jgi:uncharacterized lipoprotein YehR (DUF1307 family)
MKNIAKLIGVIFLTALLVISMTTCGSNGAGSNGSSGSSSGAYVCNYPKYKTSGRLTITGLNVYNDYFVHGYSDQKDIGGFSEFVAHGVNDTQQAVKIINGSVTLMVWKYSRTAFWYCLGDFPNGTHVDAELHEVSYSGNDSGVKFNILVGTKEFTKSGDTYLAIEPVTVDFTKGIASGIFHD